MPDYKVSFNPKGLFLSLKVNTQLLHIQTFICTQIYICMSVHMQFGVYAYEYFM